MELYYNPEQMTETEIKETFVANQWLVDEILSILKQQPKGAGVQHALIIAPRGMGKTTILLMLRFSILGSEMARLWQPVLFPEESYEVYDLADFWLSGLGYLATETNDQELHNKISQLQRVHPESNELEQAALATLKDWRNENKKQLLMLVDSFDIILDQIGDERDNARLRNVLMNDGTMMLVGGATTFLKQARDYDQALYNLFKRYDLQNLTTEQIHELLRRRAKLDGIEHFEEQLRRNASRLRVLEYFTGGNPRLVMMLYRVITRSDVSEVRRGLEKLLDEVTPYYKAKIESLPPQQRKILDHIARISARTREGLTPTEIAASVRLGVNQVTSQLKRLADIGYVRSANIRGRSSYYTLSEPLYAIWHQMRFGREARERMNWLVTFLKGWYDAEEINAECARLQHTFQEYITAGRLNEARDVLEYHRYLLGALENDSDRARTFEEIVLSYLQLEDIDTLKRELLPEINPAQLSPDIQLRLAAAGLITQDLLKRTTVDETSSDPKERGAEATLELGIAALKKNDRHKAIRIFQQALDLAPNSVKALIGIVTLQSTLGNLDQALLTIENAETYFAANDFTLSYLRTIKTALSGNFEDCAATINEPDVEMAVLLWRSVGVIFSFTSKFDDALKSFFQVAELDPKNFETWYDLADSLRQLNRYEEALASVDRALGLEPNSAKSHYLRGFVLCKLGRHHDALLSLDLTLELGTAEIRSWLLRGATLMELGKSEEGLQSFEKACEVEPEHYEALLARSMALISLGRNEEAVAAVDEALRVEPKSFDARYFRGLCFSKMNMDQAATEEFRLAFSDASSTHRTLWNTTRVNSTKFMLSLSDKDFAKAREDWRRLQECVEAEGGQELWVKTASGLLIQAARKLNWEFIRELITTSELEEPLFPLARALDYLIKGDEALIEKLSPEVKKSVEEIVGTLNKSAPANNQNRKSKRGKTRKKAI